MRQYLLTAIASCVVTLAVVLFLIGPQFVASSTWFLMGGTLTWGLLAVLALNVTTVVLIYRKRGASGRLELFCLGSGLVLLAAIWYGGAAMISSDIEGNLGKGRMLINGDVLLAIKLAVDFFKDVIAFGFAAFGANVAAAAALEK